MGQYLDLQKVWMLDNQSHLNTLKLLQSLIMEKVAIVPETKNYYFTLLYLIFISVDY